MGSIVKTVEDKLYIKDEIKSHFFIPIATKSVPKIIALLYKSQLVFFAPIFYNCYFL